MVRWSGGPGTSDGWDEETHRAAWTAALASDPDLLTALRRHAHRADLVGCGCRTALAALTGEPRLPAPPLTAAERAASREHEARVRARRAEVVLPQHGENPTSEESAP